MEEEEKAQQAPQESHALAIPIGNLPQEAEHGSTQEPPLQVLVDKLSKLDISKMAKSQENPYMHLLDKEVNQSAAEPITQDQPDPINFPLEQVFQDLPSFDHVFELRGEDFKAFEANKEQEQAAAQTLQQIHDEEQLRPKVEKGKAKVEGQPPIITKVVITKPVDEVVGSSKVFSMAQWQTQITRQMKEVAEAYYAKVSLNQEALKQYRDLNDQMQDKIIEMVEMETMYRQLQVVFQAKMAE